VSDSEHDDQHAVEPTSTLHSDADDDDDVVWLDDAPDSASESAIFVPGRLLGTSDSFRVKSVRDVPRGGRAGHLQKSIDQNAEGCLSASWPELSATSAGSHGDGGHGDASADEAGDAFDEGHGGPVTSLRSAPFVRDKRLRRLQNLRRPVIDHTSE